jgi:hypothetical protein
MWLGSSCNSTRFRMPRRLVISPGSSETSGGRHAATPHQPRLTDRPPGLRSVYLANLARAGTNEAALTVPHPVALL